MLTSNQATGKGVLKPLFVILALLLIPTSTPAVSVDREGTALFFSFEELTEELHLPASPPVPPSSPFRQLPEEADRESWIPESRIPEEADRESWIEEQYQWGNGLGFNSFAYPGTRAPLWGY